MFEIQSLAHKTTIIVGMILILTSSLIGKDEEKATSIGNIGLTISNFGTIGDGFVIQSPNDFPSGEYPLDSGIEHMFIGGLWVGAKTQSGELLVTTGAVDVPNVATRPFAGFEFTNSADVNDTIQVLSSIADSPFYSPFAVSHQDFIADFADTNTNVPVPGVDPNDWEVIADHNPLGIAVHLETYTWNYHLADAFVILNYRIRNVRADRTPLEDVYVGIWSDLVVRNINVAGSKNADFFSHVASGYIDSLQMAYAFDFDGDPGFTDEGLYIALKLLGVTQQPTDDLYSFKTRYNTWFFRNNDDPFFFSPTTDSWNGPVQGRYQKMSIDSSIIANDIVPQLGSPGNFMTLITTGPFDSLSWGLGEDLNGNWILDSEYDATTGELIFTEDANGNGYLDSGINVVFAVVAAPKVGTDPREDDTEESKRTLFANSSLAKEFYEANFNLSSILLPPHEINITWGENSVELNWEPSISDDLIGYNIYRRVDLVSDRTRINGALVTDSSYIDLSPTAGQIYYYSIKSVDSGNRESFFSHELVGIPSAPFSPIGISTSARDRSIELQWEPNLEADLAGYNVYRDDEKVNSTIVTGISYRDNMLTNFHRYRYHLTAVDMDGFESLPSGNVPAFSHAFTSVLVLNEGDIDTSLYLERLTYLDYAVGQWNFDSEGPLLFGELDDFKSVAVSTFNPSPVLEEYLLNGGNLLFASEFERFRKPNPDQLIFLGVDSLDIIRKPDGTRLNSIWGSWDVDFVPLKDGYPTLNIVSSIIPAPYEFISSNETEVVYRLESNDRWIGEPVVGIKHVNQGGGTIIALSSILSDLGPEGAIDSFLVRVIGEEFGISIGIDDEKLTSSQTPSHFSLGNNYPNPFNPETVIEYTLPIRSEVNMNIYNLRGQEIARLVNERQEVGYHKVTWNASNFASGIYFYRLQAGDFVQTRKMVLLK